MEFIPTSTIVIDNDTGVTLLNDEDMSLSLPDHAEIQALKGSIISIANKELRNVMRESEVRSQHS